MRKVLLAAGMAILSHSLMAQLFTGTEASKFHPSAQVVRMDNRSKAPLFISFTENSFIPASAGMESFVPILKSNPADSWKFLRDDIDDIGMNHHRYQQLYKGVPVVTGEYILHEKNGRIVSANGMFYDGLTLSTSPTVNESTALQNALNDIGASTYIWQTDDREQIALVGHSVGTNLPQGELVVLPSLGYEKSQNTALCWKFDIYAINPHERFHIYINAVDGRVMFKENRICTFVANGSGNTKYSGTQSFITDSIAPGSYRLRDISRGGGVQTFNMVNGTNYAGAVEFTDTDNIWTSTVNQDNVALDVHWGTQKTYDYYLSVHSRNSYNNAGAVLKSYVHYSSGYNNAFWNGTQMTYGDGDGTTFSPLTEIDVVGHELTHGVTENSSGLLYSYQSGALNESFSDIFGVTIDFFSKPATANWKIGDQCYTPGTPGDALRYMDNPNGASNPDTYLGTYWYTGTGDNGGVHYNSGVQNFWYYLLCIGGSGTNDVGFNYNVTGVTMAKARLITYRNNSFYLTSGAQYSDAAYYSLQSATDLYGNCSPEALSVKNAWDAVNVMGLQINAAATVTSSTPCAGGSIQLNAAGGNSFVWTGPGGFSSTLQNPVILNATAGNNGTYSCLITNANGCSSSKSLQITVNPAPSVTASAGGTICSGGSVNLTSTATVAGAGNSSGSNNTLFNIPDANQTGISSPITIGQSLSASSIISVKIDSLIHPYTADLSIQLQAPNGSVITLASGVGGSGDNFINTIFTSSAATAIASGVAPFTGTYLPQQSFSTLTGSANGTWNLKVIDAYSQDVGSLRKWSIVLSPNVIVSYNWSPTTGLTTSTTQNTTASPVSTTTYTVVATDAVGCSSSASSIVNISSPSATATVNNPNCAGETGSIIITGVTGGVAPYTYLWGDGSTGSSLLNVSGGFYTVVISDAAGCSTTLSRSINSPIPLSLGIGSSDATCGNNDGSISVSASGGAQPYTYLWSNGATTADIQNLAAGVYTVTVTDANGCIINGDEQVGSTGVIPNPPGAVSGPPGACRNQNSVSFSVVPVSGAIGYVWTLPTGATGASTTNSISVNFNSTYNGGNVCVSVQNACGQSAPVCYNVPYLAAVPATPASITGPSFACAGSIQQFSCTSALNAETYTWTVPATATIVSGQGTNIVSISFASNFVSGAISVKAGNCKGLSGSRSKTFYAKPGTPGVMTGASSGVCAGTTGTYSVPVLVSASTYDWTVPASATITNGQGTNSIAVSFGSTFTSGAITVTASNVCGTSALRSLTINSKPLTPGTISAASTVACVGTTANYSVVAVAGATSYSWSVPAGATILTGQGTNAISVQFDPGFTTGAVSVSAVNSCGSSALRSITLTSVPSRPNAITGAASNLCSQAGTVYSVPLVTNATSYSWSVPSFATIVSGQGTNSITVDFAGVSGSGGSICVLANNNCGSSISRCLSPVSTLPLKPSVITGPVNVCSGQQNIAYSVVGQPGAIYTWTTPAGCTIVSGQGTGSIVVNWGVGSGAVSTIVSNSCGAQTARSLTVGINCRIAGSVGLDLELYPNPSRTMTHLKVSGTSEAYTVTLTDIAGKLIFTEVMNTNENDIDVSGLNAGIYLIKVICKDGSEKVARFAKE